MVIALDSPPAGDATVTTYFDGIVNGVELWIVANTDGSVSDAGAWCPGCQSAICDSTSEQSEALRAADQHDCPNIDPTVPTAAAAA